MNAMISFVRDAGPAGFTIGWCGSSVMPQR